jgi:hypothetical protein
MKVLGLLLFMLGLMFASSAMASESSEPAESTERPSGTYIENHQKIEINSYEPLTSAFEVTDLKNYGQGPFFATAESLSKALPGVSVESLLQEPKGFIGRRFKLRADLPIMQFFEHEALKEEFERRRKKYSGF